MADNGIEGAVIGVALDGTGYGTDGKIWGGEFLVCDFLDFERRGHLRYVPLAGGDSAVRQPWRSALAYLRDAFGDRALSAPAPDVSRHPAKHMRAVDSMIATQIQTIETSSCGRLFDAVSSLIGIRHETTYEGQAAIELEMAAGQSMPPSVSTLSISTRASRFRSICGGRSRPSSAISSAASRPAKSPRDSISPWPGHRRVLRPRPRIAWLAPCLSERRNVSKSAPAGHAVTLLRESGFEVFIHRRVPTNDGGLALGQAVIASRTISR